MPETEEQSTIAQVEAEEQSLTLESVFQPYEDQPKNVDEQSTEKVDQADDGNPLLAQTDQASEDDETTKPTEIKPTPPQDEEVGEGEELTEVTLDDGTTASVPPAIAKMLEAQTAQIKARDKDYKSLQGYDTKLSQELKALKESVGTLQQA